MRRLRAATACGLLLGCVSCGDGAPASASASAPSPSTLSPPKPTTTASSELAGESRRRVGGPRARAGAAQITGEILHEPVHRAVRESVPALKGCYDEAIKKSAALKGRIIFTFSLGADGAMKDLAPDADLKDTALIECAQRVFAGLKLPKPKSGMVTVRYPILFSPGDTIQGKPAKGAGPADVEKALRDAGVTDLSTKPSDAPKGGAVLSGKHGNIAFSVTVFPSTSGAPDAKQVEALEKLGLVYTDEGLLLAFEAPSLGDAEKIFRAVVIER